MPLLFAASAIAMVAGAKVVRRLGHGDERGASRALAGDSVAFVTAYAFTAFGHVLPVVVLGVLVGFWVARILRGTPRWLVVFSLVAALVGPAVEATLSAAGLVFYRAPDLVGVPMWLPALYLHAGLLAGPTRAMVES